MVAVKAGFAFVHTRRYDLVRVCAGTELVSDGWMQDEMVGIRRDPHFFSSATLRPRLATVLFARPADCISHSFGRSWSGFGDRGPSRAVAASIRPPDCGSPEAASHCFCHHNSKSNQPFSSLFATGFVSAQIGVGLTTGGRISQIFIHTQSPFSRQHGPRCTSKNSLPRLVESSACAPMYVTMDGPSRALVNCQKLSSSKLF